MKWKFKPINDYILTKKLKYHQKSQIILTNESTLVEKDLLVVAVSDGNKVKGQKRPLAVQVGDKVRVGKLAGLTIQLDGEEYLMIKESDIDGILDE